MGRQHLIPTPCIAGGLIRRQVRQTSFSTSDNDARWHSPSSIHIDNSVSLRRYRRHVHPLPYLLTVRPMARRISPPLAPVSQALHENGLALFKPVNRYGDFIPPKALIFQRRFIYGDADAPSRCMNNQFPRSVADATQSHDSRHHPVMERHIRRQAHLPVPIDKERRSYLSRWVYPRAKNAKNVDFPRFVYLRQKECDDWRHR